MFDPPEADKCLLASGELDVRPLKSSFRNQTGISAAGGGVDVSRGFYI